MSNTIVTVESFAPMSNTTKVFTHVFHSEKAGGLSHGFFGNYVLHNRVDGTLDLSIITRMTVRVWTGEHVESYVFADFTTETILDMLYAYAMSFCDWKDEDFVDNMTDQLFNLFYAAQSF